MDVAKKIIKLELLVMGFDLKSVNNLLKYENVTDTN